VQKNGKRALNKAQNLNLKYVVEEAYKELTQLQDYSGSDKEQRCFDLAGKWRYVTDQSINNPLDPRKRHVGFSNSAYAQSFVFRNGVSAPDPTHPPPPAVHESGRSADNASISSEGSQSIPDQFYETSMASKSGGIDTHDEENPAGDTPGSSKIALNVPHIDEPDGDGRSHPSEQYEKHDGRFADAAPKSAPLTIGQKYLDPRQAQRKELSEDGSKTVVIATRTGSGDRTVITERDQEGNIRHVVTGITPGTTAVRVITERAETGEEILAPVEAPEGEDRVVVEDRDADGRIRYIISRHRSTSSSVNIVAERTSTGETRYVIVGGFGGNAIRVITEHTPSGELRMIPTNEKTGELRRVTTERRDSGTVHYIVGDIIGQTTTTTRDLMGPRIASERNPNGQIRYVIVDPYDGDTIRTKFERVQMTGEYTHIPVKEPEGELRYVLEEKTGTGETRKVIGGEISGGVIATFKAAEEEHSRMSADELQRLTKEEVARREVEVKAIEESLKAKEVQRIAERQAAYISAKEKAISANEKAVSAHEKASISR
jgi:hypothetical protein